MDYFSILKLKQEPFSNSPDPEFFFSSREHQDCLQKLELSLILRRGLNVIIGDVGTGKTTLCRQLIRKFAKRDEIETHLILDPYFVDAHEFLTMVGKMIMGPDTQIGNNEWQIKEQIKQHLFKSGVDQNKTTVLIIDEGQKIPVFCMEILREFLNYETNEYKLLQIIIFAQNEFENTIKKHANFADRINLRHYLQPLSFRDTRLMIKFRLEKSKETNKKIDIFTYPALVAIYRASNGYPRKIINLCHHCILAMIIQNRTKVSYSLVRSCVKRIFPKETWRWRRITATAGVALVIAAVIFALQMPGQLTSLLPDKITQNRANIQQQENFDSNDLKAHQVNMQSKKNPPLHEPVTPSETSATVTSEPVSTDTQMIATAAPLAATQRPIEPITDNPIASEYAYQALEDERQTKEPYDQILGNVTLKRNETLSLIIQKVYGIYNSKYFRSLILANPEIDDPDLVKVGQIIYLPAIPASVKPLNTKVWWILVQEKDTLEAAFDYVRSYPAQAPPARLVPYWNHQSGTRFAVVLKTYFYDQASALRQLNQLPLSLSAAGKVLSLWNEKTVFFADPFAGGRHLAKFKVKRD